MHPALKPLAEMRMNGSLPSDRAWILFGDYEQSRWWECDESIPEVVIPLTAPFSRMDFRPIVGLHVLVQTKKYTPSLMKLCERIREYAPKVDVFVAEWLLGTIGFRWDRGSDVVGIEGTGE